MSRWLTAETWVGRMRDVRQVEEVQLLGPCLLTLDAEKLALARRGRRTREHVGSSMESSAQHLCRVVMQVPLLMVSASSRPPILEQSLFPDNTYRHDSGGDPTQIPDLKFEEFQDFHSKYYHPSNAK